MCHMGKGDSSSQVCKTHCQIIPCCTSTSSFPQLTPCWLHLLNSVGWLTARTLSTPSSQRLLHFGVHGGQSPFNSQIHFQAFLSQWDNFPGWFLFVCDSVTLALTTKFIRLATVHAQGALKHLVHLSSSACFTQNSISLIHKATSVSCVRDKSIAKFNY